MDGLPLTRLTAIGMNSGELQKLERLYTLAQPMERSSMREFFASKVEQDLAEWLEIQREVGHFIVPPSAGPITEDEQAMLDGISAFIPMSQKGAASGVATLDGEEHLTLSQVPLSVVSSSAVGFAPSVIWLDTTPEFYGAKGDGVTNDTAAFTLCAEAIKANGGGVMRLSAKTYIVDGYEWLRGVSHEGRGAFKTVLKAAAGSANEAQITIAPGVVEGNWKGIFFEPHGNANQGCFLAHAVEHEGQGGISSSTFEDCSFGINGATGYVLSWGGFGAMWLRGGAANNKCPHQFITFRNCNFSRENTGANATTTRDLLITGQVEKVESDAACVFTAAKSERVGTSIEIGREFLPKTTLAAEAKAGETEVTVAATAGIEAGNTLMLGEGAFSERVTVASVVSGTVLKLSAALAFIHAGLGSSYAVGTRVKLLSGESINPAIVQFHGSTIQNSDLHVLAEKSQLIDFYAVDFEVGHRTLRALESSFSVNMHGSRNLECASEGTANGTAIATVGSAVLTAATGAWEAGSVIVGPGINTTVKEVKGAELVLNAVVAANGTEGAQSVALIKGGEGKGYFAKYETNSTGTCRYYTLGPVDQGVVNSGGASVQVELIDRGAALQVIQTTGVTLASGTAVTLNIFGAQEVALTDAAHAIKTIQGLHGPGETVRFRATTANTTLETGGNLNIPEGKLVLAVGDVATFARTDYGTLAWTLVGVQRAAELPGAWTAIESLAAAVEENANYQTIRARTENHAAVGRLRGVVSVKTGSELKANETFLVLPAGLRPPGKVRIQQSTNREIVIEANGHVSNGAAVTAGNSIFLDGLTWNLT
jgi:hypothetical protein